MASEDAPIIRNDVAAVAPPLVAPPLVVPLAMARGTNQSGMRQHNELLLLSLIRAHGQLPKAEMARLTGLSAQTVSVIIRQLESEGLVEKRAALRGKVGQPLQPYALNPEGAFSIGLKVGRRSGDLVLLDLAGETRNALHQPYDFPTPKQFMRFAEKSLGKLTDVLNETARKRVAGVGVAAPFDLWKWEEEAGAPPKVLEAWKDFDLASEISSISPWPVHFCNDATAACAAEQFFGHGKQLKDYAYFYVGYFVGGGIVIDGHLHQGRGGNAGALGSIPVRGVGGKSEQLIRQASLSRLERDLREHGVDPSILFYAGADWSGLGAHLTKWIGHAARGLAQAATSLAATLECKAVIIDGSMPADVRKRLVDATRLALAEVNLDGITPFEIEEGSIGFAARALGGASLPLSANFLLAS
jgi:predicted NBD/HSP70 family sugar kinase